MGMWMRRVLAVITVVGLLGACGEDEGNSSATDDTTKATEKPADSKKDQALAEDIVLVLEDFPSGWVEGEEDEEEDSDDEAAPGDECFTDTDTDVMEKATTGEADSPDFTQGELTTAGSTATVTDTEANAKKAFSVISDGDFLDCLESAMREEIESDPEEGVSVDDLAARKVPFKKLGDASSAFRIEINMSVEAQEIAAFADFVFFRAGRVFGMLYFVNFSEPFSADVAEDLGAAMARRAEAA